MEIVVWKRDNLGLKELTMLKHKLVEEEDETHMRDMHRHYLFIYCKIIVVLFNSTTQIIFIYLLQKLLLFVLFYFHFLR